MSSLSAERPKSVSNNNNTNNTHLSPHRARKLLSRFCVEGPDGELFYFSMDLYEILTPDSGSPKLDFFYLVSTLGRPEGTKNGKNPKRAQILYGGYVKESEYLNGAKERNGKDRKLEPGTKFDPNRPNRSRDIVNYMSFYSSRYRPLAPKRLVLDQKFLRMKCLERMGLHLSRRARSVLMSGSRDIAQ